MPTLSWNEIRHRAIRFSREHRDDTSEAGERQTFWNEFFEVFGVRRRTVASFEDPGMASPDRDFRFPAHLPLIGL
jgi:nuclear transport factor 2 (NTF2) superfamily protein